MAVGYVAKSHLPILSILSLPHAGPTPQQQHHRSAFNLYQVGCLDAPVKGPDYAIQVIS